VGTVASDALARGLGAVVDHGGAGGGALDRGRVGEVGLVRLDAGWRVALAAAGDRADLVAAGGELADDGAADPAAGSPG
jgi:hypothetical protein